MSLTPGMRKAIELRELGERSTEETARLMGISVGAVKARVFHGRRKLRERWITLSDQRGRPQRRFTNRSATPDISRAISFAHETLELLPRQRKFP